jgi:hypothetical protein
MRLSPKLYCNDLLFLRKASCNNGPTCNDDLINEFKQDFDLTVQFKSYCWVLYFSWIDLEFRGIIELISWILDRYSNRYEFLKFELEWNWIWKRKRNLIHFGCWVDSLRTAQRARCAATSQLEQAVVGCGLVSGPRGATIARLEHTLAWLRRAVRRLGRRSGVVGDESTEQERWVLLWATDSAPVKVWGSRPYWKRVTAERCGAHSAWRRRNDGG